MMSQSPAQELRELATAAMIGIERAAAKHDAASFMNRSAVRSVQARAGFKPRNVEDRLPECPRDPRPVARRMLMATLAQLVAASDAPVIEEWAELARAKGVRVAESFVPAVLDWWARQPRRSEVVFSVLGKPGEWLMSLNDAWRKLIVGDIPANATEIWETGRTPERAALLTAIRRMDPARACAMVQATWETDGAEERRRFLEVLLEGVSPAEEPFLESVLADRSKVVRRQAVALLGKIPGSRLRLRMNERLKHIIEVKEARGGRTTIALVPPSAFDASWERDGMEETPAASVGKRAWWMRQIIAESDIGVWDEVTGLPPRDILEAIAKDDHFEDAVKGMLDAARVSKDPAWIGALLDVVLEGKKLKIERMDSLAVIRELDCSEQEAFLLRVLGHKKISTTDWWTALSLSERRWSADFSAKVIEFMKPERMKSSNAYHIVQGWDAVARLIAPQFADHLGEIVETHMGDEVEGHITKSVVRVRLRASMYKEFGL